MSGKNSKANTVSEPKLLTLKQSAAYLEVSDHYFRKQLREGKIEAVKVPYKDYNGVEHWMVSIAVLDAIKAKRALQTPSVRPDGRRKYNIYATAEEAEGIVKTNPIYKDPALFHFANPRKAEASDEATETETETDSE